MPAKCTESVIGEGGLCQGNDSFHWNSGGSWSSGISFSVQTCLISELVPEDNIQYDGYIDLQASFEMKFSFMRFSHVNF